MPTEPVPAAPPSRLLFLDWLRIGAFALLVLYHVGMYYVSWGWHVKSPLASAALEPWMRLSSPWRLSLLFLVSGAATSFMLQRAGASGSLLAARSKRLLWPLLFGMAVVVPPQSYFEVVQQHGYAGSYLDFLTLYFSGHDGFCKAGGGCLILPTWNHLWFVAYLFVYTLLLWALLRRWPHALDRAAQVSARVLRGPALLALPIAAFAVLRLTLLDRFAPTHALVGDWYLHACYFAVFALGAMWARDASIWQRCAQWRWVALLLALLAWSALVVGNGAAAGATMPLSLLAAMRMAYATMQWSAIVAAVGFACVHLNRDHRWRATLAEAVFPVYIVHQTLIIVFAMALAPLRAAPVVEAPVLVAGTFTASFAVYLLVRRVPWLRAVFGLGPAVSRAAAPGARLATRETA
ncbi:MAG: acyltransferase family protein [Ideonella sp.]|nr:acyltransferase family protein [Ideonella sp.]MCC7457196.1 acyltransferase family protein [Nitrospira sp.]